MRDLKYYNKFTSNEEDESGLVLPDPIDYPAVSCIAVEEITPGDYAYEVRYSDNRTYNLLPFGIYAHTSTEIGLYWVPTREWGLSPANNPPGTTLTPASTTIFSKIDNSPIWMEVVPDEGAGIANHMTYQNYYTTIHLPKGSTLWLCSTGLYKESETSTAGSPKITTKEAIVKITSTGPVSILGNITSLVGGTSWRNTTYTGTSNAFKKIFMGLGDKLISARHLILPATASASSQYESTFEGCTALTEPPVLPYNGLLTNSYEYAYMFKGCVSLSYLSTRFYLTPPNSGSGAQIQYRAVVYEMMKGVGNSGIFRKNPYLTDEQAATIAPEGWELVDIEEEEGD